MAEYHPSAYRPWYRRWWGISLILLAGLGVYLAVQEPSDLGPWQQSHEHSAQFEIQGRQLLARNVRDFRYADRRRVVEPRYLERSFQLDELSQIWFGLSHFGPYGLAHSLVSFEFSDGQTLTISIEGRLRPGQVYSPIRGMFRRYTKVYIASTEQDVIGLRSHWRGETVLLYPVMGEGNQEDAVPFLLALVEDANSLHREPELYNTVLDNCLTNLLKHTAQLSEISAADFRVLLPGHTDRLTYALGITPDDLSFSEARRRATVNPTLAAIDDPEFSDSLRCGWYDYFSIGSPACSAWE